MTSLYDLPTPCLLIEQSIMRANIARLAKHLQNLGCTLRPHVKTHKSTLITEEIAKASPMSGITVSTLAEAKHFFEHGYQDILYAVGITPNKFSLVRDLMHKGCKLKVILDSLEAAELLVQDGESHACCYQVLIELDVDGHRAGVKPEEERLLTIAELLNKSRGTELMGVMTHAGGSYNCESANEQLSMAQQERDLSLLAAKRIREAGIACPIVSIGSTPTAFAVDHLEGITEVRAGVYVLFDLVMAGLGVCKTSDIAISVLSSIIGFQTDKALILCDAGWMAMSRDRGTEGQKLDQGYGLVLGADLSASADMIMSAANQEHGLISERDKCTAPASNKTADPSKHELLRLYSIGELIRILPNHACSTAAQFPYYYLVNGETVLEKLTPVNGWV